MSSIMTAFFYFLFFSFVLWCCRFQGFCDMSVRPARLVGGAGQTRDTAAPSCAFIASSFPAEAVNGVFWVLASAGDRGSGRQRLCLRNPTTGAFQENGGDGLSAINAALSCSVSGESDRSRWPGMRIGEG